VILVDGQSTDATMKIVNTNESFFHKIISEKDNGMYDAINKGFKYASGDIYCYINSDDLLKKYTLEKVSRMFYDTKADLVFGDVEYIDENGNFIYKMNGTKLSKKGISYIKRVPFAQQSSFWTAQVFNEIGGFDSSLKYVADSKFLLGILLSKNTKYKYIPNTLSAFRLHSDSFSIGSAIKMESESTAMRNNLDLLKNNYILRLYYEFFTKIRNIKGIYQRIKYKGHKLK
jgi:glycosyltransferase involved in cell wall biosynthesis